MGRTFCSVSPARYAGSSFTYAKRTPHPHLSTYVITIPERPHGLGSSGAGVLQSEVKEEGPHGPGDTNGAEYPPRWSQK